ncbi:sulfotransferase [Streptomyces abikoensis]|uniref:sulfotransferase family protein n=1 Tax=Streptomyces abikoensis TaxID=97398 RepID=UPI0033D31DCB
MRNRHAASCVADESIDWHTHRTNSLFEWSDVSAAALLERGGVSSVKPCFAPAYHRLTDSLTEEARLTPAGLAVTRRRLVFSLANQLAVRELIENRQVDPELHGGDAVFVLGLPGTGLRRLQRLLFEHSALNIPSLREILSPAGDWRPWLPESLMEDPFEQALLSRLSGGGFRGAELGAPHGDHLLLTYAFHTPSASLEYRIPGYSDWLQEQDATVAYQFHRYALAAILERVGGGTPLLVNEFHSMQLPALLRAYPTARLIRVHRDPLESLSHVAGLSTMRRLAWSRWVDPREVAAEWARRLGTVLATPEWHTESPGGAAVLDITHEELTETPLLTVRRICEFLQVPLTSGIERRILEQDERLPGGDCECVAREHYPTGEVKLPEIFRELRDVYCRQWGVPAA